MLIMQAIYSSVYASALEKVYKYLKNANLVEEGMLSSILCVTHNTWIIEIYKLLLCSNIQILRGRFAKNLHKWPLWQYGKVIETLTKAIADDKKLNDMKCPTCSSQLMIKGYEYMKKLQNLIKKLE